MNPQVDACPRWSQCLELRSIHSVRRNPIVVGVLPGDGVGPEVIGCTLKVLHAVARAADFDVDVRQGGPIGRDAERLGGKPLSRDVIRFCEDAFGSEGVILNGPGGGRYVYDLRKHFDLFFKISPIQIANGLPRASRFHSQALEGVDILIAREGKAGVYQGRWDERRDADNHRVARHLTTYAEPQVRRFLDSSARLAKLRRGNLTVVWKESGTPTISKLWRDCAADAAAAHGVEYAMVDIDLMAYRLIQDASSFNVVAAPNLFGDVLADLGAVLLGSRGLSYSGNFTPVGHAVYQTNHGAAYDLAGSDRVNPVGQILSLAMMLRESFKLPRAARAIERAVRSVWDEGFCTIDVAVPGGQVIGTREMGSRIAERAEQILQTTRSELASS